ncbi:aminoacyl-tRNA hydrolase [Neisseria shayeganii]|uniref:Peptidyl-tRNA hydrolase n=1 Tax=Neisseria shayeganii 871 TaxID=1032488 RepID=G4CHK4_9NEIS|nr:aminoacyl-tRNA hydrolase [Neisseria shayeganii]EGY52669.1 aminoacyl-tRNA hydrolase [Neisseria shayeganii 871]
MNVIKLVVGLGNPGPEYADTRHNAGFWLADELAWQWKAAFKEEKKFFGETARAKLPDGEVWLLKPNTYMNRSGQAVQALAQFYKIAPQEILVLHDELDIAPGRIKFKLGGGNGGHNGLKDIQAKLGSADFYRLRLGIGHPGERNEVVNYVLKKPRAEERELIDAAVRRSAENMGLILSGDFAAAQRQLHSAA